MHDTKKKIHLIFPVLIVISLLSSETFAQDCSAQELAITTSTLPSATARNPYTAAVAASGGRPSYDWTCTGLPEGLSCIEKGCSKGSSVYHPQVYIQGRAAIPGAYNVLVTVNDGTTVKSSTYQLNVLPDISKALAVLYPNGNEKFKIGKTYELRWKFAHPTETEQVKTIISLQQADGNAYKEKIRVASDTSTLRGDNNILWQVPAGSAGEKYRISVKLDKTFPTASGSVMPEDSSDNDFSIIPDDGVNGAPQITGIPSPPARIQPGQSVSFSWRAFDEDNDDLIWQIDWGDGTKDEQTCPAIPKSTRGGWIFTKTHSWAESAVYNVKATASDCKGGKDTKLIEVRVGSSRRRLPPAGGPPPELEETE